MADNAHARDEEEELGLVSKAIRDAINKKKTVKRMASCILALTPSLLSQ